MEIERSIDYGNKVLVLYNPKKGFKPSSMVRAVKGIKIKPYQDMKEFGRIVKEFLPRTALYVK